MASIQKVTQLSVPGQTTSNESLQPAREVVIPENIWKKLRVLIFLVLGYLLSPLCWWNDLLFNLPIAYGFGYMCSSFSPKLLLPCSIIGYWLSNVVGILLMQFGSVDVFQKEPKRNLKKELFSGLVSSTVYTLVIMLLIHLKIINTPVLFTHS